MSVHRLDDRRKPCRCMPWQQTWTHGREEVCTNCGGLFPPRTVPARRGPATMLRFPTKGVDFS